MIKVKLLHDDALVPTVNYAGSDLGFDLYAVEDTLLEPGVPVKVRTGIAVEGPEGCGFVLGDRSSMAAKGVTYAGGRIDAGYRGEILVCLVNLNQPAYRLHTVKNEQGLVSEVTLERGNADVWLRRGDKIAQLSPFPSMTYLEIAAVEDLTPSDRGAKGFGSSGR
jgi:dUTP pyrophosphatase